MRGHSSESKEALRRGEPPNPTPSRVRAVRRRGELMVAAAEGRSFDELADRFGFGSADGAARAVERARDAVFPFDLLASIEFEQKVWISLAATLAGSMSPAVGEGRRLKAARLTVRSCELVLTLRAAREASRRAERDEAWSSMMTADLGAWTDALSMRAAGRSFHDIAERHGFVDFFNANQLVAVDLLRFEQGCAVRLRAAQIDAIDADLNEVWAAATCGPLVDLGASSRMWTLLARRYRIRGIGLPFPGPLIEHPPEVRR